MSRFSLAHWLLTVLTWLCVASCDDGANKPIELPDAVDTAVAADTTPTDAPIDTEAPDTRPDDDTGADTAADSTQDTHTTGIDVSFDIDYDLDGTAPDTTPTDTSTDLVTDTADDLDTADAVDTDDTDDTTGDLDDTADTTGPPTDFDDLANLRDAALRTALLDRIDEHTSLGYDAARDAMYDATTGVYVDGGLIECVYTGKTAAPDGTNTPGGTHNTEHTWPQSLGAGTEPARSDLHHLFPATQNSNSVRGNTAYGDTSCDQSATCSWFDSGSELGASSVDGSSVFEVRSARRGDIARAHFYFAVRYELSIGAVTEASLRQWNLEDPPDDLERGRNDTIESLQSNRNPFVDRPDFVDYISDF